MSATLSRARRMRRRRRARAAARAGAVAGNLAFLACLWGAAAIAIAGAAPAADAVPIPRAKPERVAPPPPPPEKPDPLRLPPRACGDGEAIALALGERYGEGPRAWLLDEAGGVLELWTGAAGHWTLVLRLAAGTACVIAHGGAHQVAPEGVRL